MTDVQKTALVIAVVGTGQIAAVMAIAPAEVRDAKATLAAAVLPNIAVMLIAAAAVFLDGQTPLINDVKYFSPYASGDFSELKIIAEFVLFLCAVFRMSVCLRAAVVTTEELAGRREMRLLLPIYAAVLFALGMGLSGNIGVFAEYLLRYTPVIGVLPLVILPTLLLAFRGKERKA